MLTRLAASALAVILLLPTYCGAETEPADPPEGTPPNGLDIVDISYMSLGGAAQRLLTARDRHEKEVVLHFDSPGGSVDAMLTFAALMRHVQLGGTKITCVVDGMAASAGFYLLEMCSERVGKPGSVYLAHEVALGEVSGKPHDIAKALKLANDLTRVMVHQMAAHMKISDAELLRRIHDNDYWFYEDEALAIGAIDRIAAPGEYDLAQPVSPPSIPTPNP